MENGKMKRSRRASILDLPSSILNLPYIQTKLWREDSNLQYLG